MSLDLSFRNAQPSDAEAITELINLAFRIERFFIEDDRISILEVRERLATGVFILAEVGDLVIGSVYVELRGENCYAGLLAVDPSRQRNGVGSRLMETAEDYARTKGCRAMDLQIVNVRTEMPAFYRRLGYAETGIQPFPSELITKMKCHFVTMAKTL
jgi:predicted N-acetyltransferase YhbS